MTGTQILIVSIIFIVLVILMISLPKIGMADARARIEAGLPLTAFDNWAIRNHLETDDHLESKK